MTRPDRENSYEAADTITPPATASPGYGTLVGTPTPNEYRHFQSPYPCASTAIKKRSADQLAALLARALSLCLLALFLVASRADAEPGQPEMVAIGFPATSEQTISLTSLRAIFGMIQREWPANTPVKVFVLPDDTAEHTNFSKSVLQLFPQQLRSAWERGVFSGHGSYPEQLASSQEMLRRVASTPGAIGYLRASEVDATVRVISVECLPTFSVPAQPSAGTPRVSDKEASTGTRGKPGRGSAIGSARPAQAATPSWRPPQDQPSQSASRQIQEAVPPQGDGEAAVARHLIDLVK
jgi:hypothetical protein